MASDFVMTIDDDLEDGKQPAVEDEEEELLSRDKSEFLNTSFSFDVDDDETDLPWNFDSAKKALMTADDRLGTSINDKIQKRIQKKERRDEQNNNIEEKRKEKASKSSKRKRAEEPEDENDESGDEDEEEDKKEKAESSEEEDSRIIKEASEDKKSKTEENEIKIKRKKPATQKLSKEAKSFFSPTPEVDFGKEWEDMSLAPILLKAIRKHGYATPTPIQAQAIPIILMGRDICGSAVTGSGKTAAFVIPIIQLLLDRERRIPTTRVLILTPTRELAAQCQSYVQGFAKYADVRSALVVGGLSVSAQETELRTFPDIVVATPGRMIDHLRNAKAVGLDDLELLILDEADRLLDMGFTAEIEEIVKSCPEKRQTLLFSATMTDEVKQLIKLSLRNPVRISVDRIFETAQTLTQEFIKVQLGENYDRDSTLLALCMRSIKSKCLIFFAHKKEAHRMKVVFGLAGLNAAELHGDLTQTQRLQALEDFRDAKVDYLLATDVAARGLDILGIETIINYTMPRSITDYVHRVGRTARAGSSGRSISLASPNDKQLLKEIMKKSQSKLKQRTVPTDAIQKCRQMIEDMSGDIAAIFKEERYEKELRVAERETAKIQNMIDYEDEIYSRPKKTWFQSSKEKENVREQAKQAALGIPLLEQQKKSEKSEKKFQKKISKDQRKRESKNKEQEREMKSQKLLAKSLKKKQREIKQGLRPKERTEKPKKKKQKTESGGSVFETEIKTSNFKKSRDLATKSSAKKGKNSFKSKSRYKRRK